MTSLNTFLQTAATGLVALGVGTIATSLWYVGAIELALGVICYIVYEKLPPSTPTL